MNQTTRRRRKRGGDMESLRAKDREYQRRRRAKFYEAGLSNCGAPLQRPDLAEKRRTVGVVDHPADCPCYGCLFPPEPYQPKVCHLGISQ